MKGMQKAGQGGLVRFEQEVYQNRPAGCFRTI